MFFSYSYLLLIIVTTIIGIAAQTYVNRQINRYSRVPNQQGLSGVEAGSNMLAANGVQGVTFHQGGPNEDFFDPRNNSITLDPDAFGGRSITAYATACHEVGHACQHAQGYVPMKIRAALVPVVSFASNSWMIFLIVGIALYTIPLGRTLFSIAILLYAFAVLFELVTLPVEFNASHRGLAYMESVGLAEGDRTGAFRVLRACALTYVAAALVSVLQLFWLLAQRN